MNYPRSEPTFGISFRKLVVLVHTSWCLGLPFKAIQFLISNKSVATISYFVYSGLKNDSQPETLHLRHKMGAHPFACRYIKIVPLQSWGSSFNFTVWYVHLGGVSNWATVETAVKWMSRVSWMSIMCGPVYLPGRYILASNGCS